MGLYNYLEIDKKHLPKELEDHQTGWQTKSYEPCLIDTLVITEDGQLLLSHYSDDGDNIEELNYTGEIRFYDYKKGSNVWLEFVAFFVEGKMIKIIQLCTQAN